MKKNDIINGFKLVSVDYVKDVSSNVYEFYHIKSGATLAYIENDDTNCVFGIAFRTLPVDSTGVCHIIEHSLLCGSEKYPLKEPFLNLLKGSMNTFLNAFTAYDWTMYPVASQTPKDFDNLVSVYLDAVFCPLSMKDKKPFLQEGWHLELMDKDSDPCYKGVVYNEMKGAMSSVDRIISQATKTAMFGETLYGFNSGGDPDVIPELTYEAYKAFYHKHYTPSNALTVLYGKMDIENKLKFIDEEYFSKYDVPEEPIKIQATKAVINTDYEVEYEIGKEESEKDNTYISLCYNLGRFNKKDYLAFSILTDVLFSDNGLIKTKILNAKLGQDLDAQLDDDNIEPNIQIILQKTNANKKEIFKDTFLNIVKDLVDNGIDKKQLTASLNRYEFKTKELDTGGMPKGLVLAMNMVTDHNYNRPLIDSLCFSEYFDELRKEINTDYFEKLLDKYILHSNYYVQVMAKPSKTLGEVKAKAMEKKMHDLKANMSDEEIEFLINQTKELIAYQNKVDTKEELATLPTLSLTDIPLEINYLDTKKIKIKGMNTFYHVLPTNKIAYLRMYFNEKVVSYEDLPYLSLLGKLLTNVPTSKYSVEDLNNEIKTYLGDLDFSCFSASTSSKEANLYFKVTCSALSENTSYIPTLLNEILLHSKFNTTKVKQVLLQMVKETRSMIIGRGNTIALQNTFKASSLSAIYNTRISGGFEFYRFISDLSTSFDGKAIVTKLKEISKKLFTKYNVFISMSGDEETVAILAGQVKEIKLPGKRNELVLTAPKVEKSSEAIIIPSGISYNAVGTNLEKYGVSRTGKFFVLNQMVNYDYLWPEVRVKGGAYGVGIVASSSNDFGLASYRDPNIDSTYEAYANIPKYLRELKINKEMFTSYIIGTLSNFDFPLSNSALINTWDANYLIGITKKARLQLKKEILKTKLNDIKELADLIEQMLNDVSKCSIGNEQKIKASNIFDKTTTL